MRLERTTPWAAHIGCSFTLAALLIGLGSLFIYLSRNEEAFLLVYIVSGGFIAVGVLILLAGIHQLFAVRTPETIVEIDAERLERGASYRVCLVQQGPVTLDSLRANLVGERRVRKGKTRTYEHLGTFNFFDSGGEVVVGDAPRIWTAQLHVPPDIAPSDRFEVTWKIEVWGKVRRRADFMHPFEVTVV